MDIETELPNDFEEREITEKIDLLENLKQEVDDSNDSGALKKRLIEEMIRKYSSP